MPRVLAARNLGTLEPPASERRHLPAVALTIALVVHAIIAASAWFHRADPAPDFDRYHEIAVARGRAYVDYRVEHPIATWAVFRALAVDSPDVPTFGGRIVVVNFAADLAIAAALVWGWGLAAAAAFAIVAAPILELLVNRIDLWSTACAALAVAAWRRDRLNVSAVAIAAGTAFKLWPLLFAPLLLTPRGSSGAEATRARRRAAAVFVVSGLVIATGWWAIAGTRGLYDVLTFRGATGWQIESTVGAVLHLARAPSLRLESGSWRIGSTSGPVSILLFAIAAPLATWTVWRGARTGRLGAGWLGGVSTLLVFSALLSAQFAAWLTPGAAIAWAENDYPSVGLAFLAVFVTEVFWVLYQMVIVGYTVPLALVVVRNILLMLLAANAIRTITAK